MALRLGINTGFAVNRYSEPEAWTSVVKKAGVNYVQFTADLLNVSLPDKIINSQVDRINNACGDNALTVTSTFTGAFTRVNHMAHPDLDVREYWVNWFMRFADLTAALGAKTMGSHFGIFTMRDDRDLVRRAERRAQNIECWHRVASYAKQKGIEQILWEPMSISREQGETIAECRRLQNDVNVDSPIPFRLCLDVDHGDVASPDPADTDPYAWLEEFCAVSPFIHLKQSSENKSGHWPFTKEYNERGRIQPKKVIDTLESNGVLDAELVLELSFKEREPVDSTVPKVLADSVQFWRPFIPR